LIKLQINNLYIYEGNIDFLGDIFTFF